MLDLLKENFGTQNKHFLIRHNSEFDSELDDEEDGNEENRSKSGGKSTTGDSDSSDLDLVNGDSDSVTNSSSSNSPRSMRLNDMTITVKDASGPLTRQLFETIKSMTASRTTVNPSPLFGQICKK